MIDRILTNRVIVFKIPEAIPIVEDNWDDDSVNCYRNPGTELSDALICIGHLVNSRIFYQPPQDIDWNALNYYLGWIYFRTCSIELPEETIPLWMSDEEWDLVNKGIELNSRHWINFNREE